MEESTKKNLLIVVWSIVGLIGFTIAIIRINLTIQHCWLIFTIAILYYKVAGKILGIERPKGSCPEGPYWYNYPYP